MPSATGGVPAARLVITEPVNGATSSDRVVVVRGTAAPGAVITRNVPFWFDEHVLADSGGRWSFVVGLNPGENIFTFRVGDDVSTEMSLTIYYSEN